MKRTLKPSLCILLVTFTVLLSVAGIKTIPAASFNIIDGADDNAYSVSVKGELVTIYSNTRNHTFYADDTVYACSVYNGVFSFMGAAKSADSYSITVYTYDVDSGNFNFFSINTEAVLSEYSFSADAYGRYYFVDSENARVIKCYTRSGLVSSVKCKGIVQQLLCVDGVNVTAFTPSGTYAVAAGTIKDYADFTPAVPCRYDGNGLITDNNNNSYGYSEGLIKPFENTTTAPPDTNLIIPGNNTGENISISGDYIYVSEGTTVAKLKKALTILTKGYTVTRADGKTITTGNVGTGTKLSYTGKEYTVIVTGDVTGEGNVNSRDVKTIMKHLTREEQLSNINSLAADIDGDKIITTKDLIRIMNLY